MVEVMLLLLMLFSLVLISTLVVFAFRTDRIVDQTHKDMREALQRLDAEDRTDA